jgi:hypothetical protein
MEIVIIQTWCHPEFGNQQTKVKKIELTAENVGMIKDTYKRMSQKDGLYKHTAIYVQSKESE